MNNIQQRETNIKTMLANKTKMLQSILGNKKKSDNFAATALQIALNPDLKDCTEESIINALVGAAMLDLNPDKNIGQVYIYKYGKEATLDVGYKGYQTIYQRAGYEIRTFPVFECDEFDVRFDGWEMKYNLVPNLEERDMGNFDWEYANLKGILVVSKDLVTGEFKRDFIVQKVIENMRLSSPNQKPSQWDKDKTIIDRKKDKLPVGVWWSWYIDMCSKSAMKKFKNQLAIRSYEQQLAMVDMLDNHKSIDFQATKEKGIIIEAKPVESKAEVKSLNDIQNQKKDPSQEILDKMIEKGVSKEKAQEYIKTLGDAKIIELSENDELLNNECMELLF